MINSQDSLGNTPLHIAINQGHKDCTLFLLDKGADTNIKNKSHQAPIHVCIISNRPSILEILVTHSSKPDVNLGGENGATPLHYCASCDNDECVKILLNNKAKICKPCDNGFYAINIAAQAFSGKAFNVLINEASRLLGYSKVQILSFVDGDNNKPLHAAVQFGNLHSVKICLDSGIGIDEKNLSDNSTSVHIASAQGSLGILKLMFEKQPEIFSEIVHSVDTIQMTPLHKASMFDHVEVAEFLIEKGANIDALDKEKRSPLLLAASRNCIQMVCYLLSKGADFEQKDTKLRNLLHLTLNPETSEKINERRGTINWSTKNLDKIIEKLLNVKYLSQNYLTVNAYI